MFFSVEILKFFFALKLYEFQNIMRAKMQNQHFLFLFTFVILVFQWIRLFIHPVPVTLSVPPAAVDFFATLKISIGVYYLIVDCSYHCELQNVVMERIEGDVRVLPDISLHRFD